MIVACIVVPAYLNIFCYFKGSEMARIGAKRHNYVEMEKNDDEYEH